MEWKLFDIPVVVQPRWKFWLARIFGRKLKGSNYCYWRKSYWWCGK